MPYTYYSLLIQRHSVSISPLLDDTANCTPVSSFYFTKKYQNDTITMILH